MKLFASPTSPFTRRIRILLDLFNQDHEVIMCLPHARPAELMAYNPLSRIPTLVLDNGDVIVDSSLIAHYLFSQHKEPTMFPADDSAWNYFNQVELVDGAMDYAVVMILESMRDDSLDVKYEQAWLSIHRILERFDTVYELPEATNYLQISLLCLLEFLDFRAPMLQTEKFGHWRDKYANLVAWHDRIKTHPSYVNTQPE